MRGASNANPLIRDYFRFLRSRQEATPSIRTEVYFVMVPGDV
jgi:hypothetical protein